MNSIASSISNAPGPNDARYIQCFRHLHYSSNPRSAWVKRHKSVVRIYSASISHQNTMNQSASISTHLSELYTGIEVPNSSFSRA